MPEYFIRYPDSEEAKGPYNLDQLKSLAEAKKVKSDSLYYDEGKEVWLAINGNLELKDTLFPADIKLSLRQKGDEELDILNKPEDKDNKKLTIEDILAAAEGDTEETKSKTVHSKRKHRTVGLTIVALAFTFLLSGAGLALFHLPTIQTLDPTRILGNHFIIIAAIDLILALCLFLSVTTIYPVVRLRAAVGLGYMAIYFYSYDQMVIVAVVAISMICTIINTFTTRVSVFFISGPGAIGGMIAFLFLYHLFLNPA